MGNSCSLETDSELTAVERALSLEKVFCLRCLFGSITYLTKARGSLLGKYEEFLSSPAVRRLHNTPMMFSDIHRFVAHMSGLEGKHHILLFLWDEISAAEQELDPTKVCHPCAFCPNLEFRELAIATSLGIDLDVCLFEGIDYQSFSQDWLHT